MFVTNDLIEARVVYSILEALARALIDRGRLKERRLFSQLDKNPQN